MGVLETELILRVFEFRDRFYAASRLLSCVLTKSHYYCGTWADRTRMQSKNVSNMIPSLCKIGLWHIYPFDFCWMNPAHAMNINGAVSLSGRSLIEYKNIIFYFRQSQSTDVHSRREFLTCRRNKITINDDESALGVLVCVSFRRRFSSDRRKALKVGSERATFPNWFFLRTNLLTDLNLSPVYCSTDGFSAHKSI